VPAKMTKDRLAALKAVCCVTAVIYYRNRQIVADPHELLTVNPFYTWRLHIA